jgi:hypothetical protein
MMIDRQSDCSDLDRTREQAGHQTPAATVTRAGIRSEELRDPAVRSRIRDYRQVIRLITERQWLFVAENTALERQWKSGCFR